MFYRRPVFCLTAVLLAAVSAAHAQTLTPVSYNTPNGDTGTYNYWDAIYTGSGSLTTDNAPLSGGSGYLTDGVLAGQYWDSNVMPNGHQGQPANWVGWHNTETPAHIVITFDFGTVQTFGTTSFYLSNGNGGGVGSGGVALPSAITLTYSTDGTNFGSGITQTVTPDNVNPSARFIDVATPRTGRYVQTTLDYQNEWVFLSEARFTAASVPAPSALLTVCIGIAPGMTLLLRRRKR